MDKMNPELKQKWIDALTSGKYQQHHAALKVNLKLDGLEKGYCCLGVLCDVIDPNGWGEALSLGRHLWKKSDWPADYPAMLSSLSSEHLAELNLSRITEEHLIQMNDDQGKTFLQIANWIEENL